MFIVAAGAQKRQSRKWYVCVCVCVNAEKGAREICLDCGMLLMLQVLQLLLFLPICQQCDAANNSSGRHCL